MKENNSEPRISYKAKLKCEDIIKIILGIQGLRRSATQKSMLNTTCQNIRKKEKREKETNKGREERRKVGF